MVSRNGFFFFQVAKMAPDPPSPGRTNWGHAPLIDNVDESKTRYKLQFLHYCSVFWDDLSLWGLLDYGDNNSCALKKHFLKMISPYKAGGLGKEEKLAYKQDLQLLRSSAAVSVLTTLRCDDF